MHSGVIVTQPLFHPLSTCWRLAPHSRRLNVRLFERTAMSISYRSF
jgi:hypothetical protein